MQKTEHYALNLFEGSDHVLAENFNANTEILDAELAKKIRGTSFTYTGDGQYTKTITFDTQPLFVVIAAIGSSSLRLGFAVYGRNSVFDSTANTDFTDNTPCSWDGCSMTLNSNNAERSFNKSDTLYRVTALLA